MRDWLAAHSSVTVISRDRSGPYTEAARTGAPTATQVADRWHLLVNASEALRGIVERHQSEIRVVVHRLVHASSVGHDGTESAPTSEVHNPRRDRCETALRFHGEGMPTKQIARRIGASRNAVRRWSELAASCPIAEPQVRAGSTVIFPSSKHVGRRASAARPFSIANCAPRASRAATISSDAGLRDRGSGAPVGPASARIPSTRRITRWLTGDPATLLPEDRAFTEALCVAAPKLRQAVEDVWAFAELLRRGDPAGLTPWLEATGQTDLGGFVTGLRQDEAAVRAAIVEPWSNGPVKGQVNRLKLIKRSMYGRAKFDLLRQRVLHAA